MHCDPLIPSKEQTDDTNLDITKEFQFTGSRNLIGSLMKFVFIATYQQSLDPKHSAFTIKNFNFGDPCFDIKNACNQQNTKECKPISFGVHYECVCKRDNQGNQLYQGGKCEKKYYCNQDVDDVSCLNLKMLQYFTINFLRLSFR